MVRVIEGDLFENLAPRSVILHQANCIGKAGAGVAYAIYSRFPGWFESYAEYCKESIPESLLGTFHTYDVPGGDIKVCSVLGQLGIGKERVQTNYDAWKKALPEIVLQLEKRYEMGDVWTVRMPYGIGCGLGGGNWNVMKDLFEYFAGYSPVDFVFYKLRAR